MSANPIESIITFFFFNDTATTEIYTLSLHDALPISSAGSRPRPTDGALWLRREQYLESRDAGPGGGGGHGQVQWLGRGAQQLEHARVHRQIIDARLHAQRVEVPVGEGRQTAALARAAIGQDERDAGEPLWPLSGRAAHPPLHHAGADQRDVQRAEAIGPRLDAHRAERRHQQRRVDRKRVDRHEDRLEGHEVPDPEPAARVRARAVAAHQHPYTWYGRLARIPTAVGVLIKERSEEHTSELQSLAYLVCRLLLEKKKIITIVVVLTLV